MKKRIVAILMAAAMASAMITACGSEETQTTSEESTDSESGSESTEGDYQYVSAADAVSAAKEGGTHVLDVREWNNYVSGRVVNSEWCPIFPLEDDSLVETMTAYAEENFGDDEDIYIICNSGQRGAQKATGVLEDAGIDASRIYTVEGGAEALAEESGTLTTNRTEDSIEWQYVSGAEAVEAVGNEDIQILDVRDDDTYAQGHLEGSLQCNLKEIEDADAQTALYEMATSEMDPEKPVYLLCYSGNNCAKTGISVLKDAGYDVSNLYIIENGAKDADVAAAFVTE
ncbi:rhodanese-like domain-containing protein [Claveliimonas bilis]|uniref:rhodanese-like domain-containing protein n=1 Tax=Claveliimonas bilis TaxID=3028070 RepID=UPI002930FB6E|nr:rhodanese-like domain-containing protein [Claveliimonas bilis]BDZ81490.1 hypothetical protein Lac3_26990 [Claveliimonas bilis]